MKKLLLAFVAVIVMVSCSKNEITDVSGNNDAIKFGAAVGNNSIGRAAVSTFGVIDLVGLKASADGFAVSTSGLGAEMNALPVTHNGTSWTYTGDYYWPINPAVNVSFTAYAPAGLAAASLSGTGLTVTSFTPSTTIANQVDILYAPPANFSRNTSGAAGVALTFNHILTQVVFAVNTDIPSASSPKIVSIVLTIPKGTGTYSGGTWTTTTGSQSYTLFNNNTISSTAIYSTPILMLPQTLASGTNAVVTFSVNGSTTSSTVDLSSLTTVTSWTAGTKVTYDISFNAADLKIKFADPTVSTWTNAFDGWVY